VSVDQASHLIMASPSSATVPDSEERRRLKEEKRRRKEEKKQRKEEKKRRKEEKKRLKKEKKQLKKEKHLTKEKKRSRGREELEDTSQERKRKAAKISASEEHDADCKLRTEQKAPAVAPSSGATVGATVPDAYACPRCGAYKDFESSTLASLEEHQKTCSGGRGCNPNGPWMCAVCGKNDFQSKRGFSTHRECCRKGALTGTHVSLRPTCLESKRKCLSDFNRLVTDSIVLIQLASEADVEKVTNKRRKKQPQVGHLGICCKFCAESPEMNRPPGSVVIPQSLECVPHNMYTLTYRHMMKSCRNIPKSTLDELTEYKKTSLSQSCKKGGIGLPLYIQHLTQVLGLTNDVVLREDGEEASQGIRGAATSFASTSSTPETSDTAEIGSLAMEQV